MNPSPSPANATRIAADAAPTKREANKLDKLRRIQQAAHELFASQGYDSTTMREIAVRAGVALGTLFLYASNKRDLLFLTANDIMIAAVDEAASLVDDAATLTYNLAIVAGVHLRILGAKPELFRLVLRELLFYDSGIQAVRASENRARLLALTQDLIANAARRGEIRREVDAELAARVVFAVMQAETRRWIASDHRVLSSGVASYRAAVSLVVGGLKDSTGPVRCSAAETRKVMARLKACRT